jgi:signal transduction histidine kinase
MIRSLKRYQHAVDAALAVVYFAISVWWLGGYFNSTIGLTGFSLVIGGYAVAVAVRRLSPPISLAIAWVFSIAQMAVQLDPSIYNVATVIVLFTTSAYGGRRTRIAGLVSVVLGSIVAAAYLTLRGAALEVSIGLFFFSELPGVLLQFTLLFVGIAMVLAPPWLLGLAIRARVRARESKAAKELAEQDVIVEQERNRIARDMHDIVAHSLAVVIAQADGARYARAGDPAAVDEALLAISTTARDALGDVRLLLTQLRHSQAEGPQPVLADLDRLLDQLRASGLSVRFVRTGEPRPLGAAQEISVYRIVQEAVTNALRHGDTTKEVLVFFDWSHDKLDITIRNGTLVQATTAQLHIGHGLAGMNERAALIGGRLRAAPEGDEFVVMATLPITAPAAVRA